MGNSLYAEIKSRMLGLENKKTAAATRRRKSPSSRLLKVIALGLESESGRLLWHLSLYIDKKVPCQGGVGVGGCWGGAIDANETGSLQTPLWFAFSRQSHFKAWNTMRGNILAQHVVICQQYLIKKQNEALERQSVYR